MATRNTTAKWSAVRNFRNKLWYTEYQDCPLVLGVTSAYPKLTDTGNQDLLQALSHRAQLQDVLERCKSIGLLSITEHAPGQSSVWVDPQTALSAFAAKNNSQSNAHRSSSLILVDNKVESVARHYCGLAPLFIGPACANDFQYAFLNKGFDQQSLDGEIIKFTAYLERTFKTPVDLLDFYIDAIDRKYC